MSSLSTAASLPSRIDSESPPGPFKTSESYADSMVTVSTSSTVPGPGAISGKFLKVVGEKTLDLIVSVIVRRRLASIQRTLSKAPYIFTNPLGAAQVQTMDQIYEDLRELCSEGQKEYYPRSVQRTAASLIQNITIITRSYLNLGTHPTRTNGKWEILLAEIERRSDSDKLVQVLMAVEVGTVTPEDLARRPRESTVVMFGGKGVGKSAIFKQFTQNWENSSQTLDSHRNVIIASTIASMRAVLLDKLQIEFAVDELNPEGDGFADLMAAHELIISSPANASNLTPEELSAIGRAIRLLWRNPAVYQATRQVMINLRTRNGLALESADYFFNSADRIFAPEYKPTPADVLRPHIPTIIPRERFLNIGKSTVRVADTSGMHHDMMTFLARLIAPQDVAIAVYVVALTDYNKLYAGKNALQHSYDMFRSLLSSPFFDTIVVLFNKVDAFKELLETVPMEKYLKNYKGNSLSDACKYLTKGFLRPSAMGSKRVFSKFVSAFDTEAMASTLRIIGEQINREH